MSGNITYNGHGLKEFVPRRTSAYVSRQDWHVPEMTMRETLDFSARCQGVGCKYDMLEELARREKRAGIKPDEDLDIFMKASALGEQETSLIVEYILKPCQQCFIQCCSVYSKYSDGPEIVVKAVLEAIELGYRCVAKCTQVQLPFSRLLQWTSADRDVESTILDEPNIRAGVPGAGLNPRSDNISGSDITEVGNMVQSPLAGQFCKGSTQPFQPSPSARRLSEVDLSGFLQKQKASQRGCSEDLPIQFLNFPLKIKEHVKVASRSSSVNAFFNNTFAPFQLLKFCENQVLPSRSIAICFDVATFTNSKSELEEEILPLEQMKMEPITSS
ncbi:uncharacterized protein LOC108212734 [Daucus carota subsp. sativus]|uniref:uncharacterized protein LOC108212734 n=1 Tax=Daucus carota subsp. sativus TaxID=79200 RepID=UPI00308309FB